ncbi:sulfotransferase 1A1-like [Biomphalaria glabrata]|uniref:Sulfotransferase 1A1-like n=1 Tax=Biomphalaria glabrata TaxID=6526 RepID=A0A9U8E0T4_BIOGL|nr:sulfotransferase 1A1-like [Biomphalaria glabrata]
MSAEHQNNFQHILPGQHVYDGVLFFGYSPPETLDLVKTFHVRADDVFLVTYPKAGTTWLQEIVWLLMHEGDFEGALATPVYIRSPFLEFKDLTLNEIGLDLASTMPSPRVIKTHLPLKLAPREILVKKPKVIILFRNPKDVCVSYFNFYKCSSSFGNFQGDWPEFLAMFCEGHVDHGSWFDFTKSWWPLRELTNVKLVFYEDLKRNPFGIIKELADFLGKQHLDDVTISRIAAHCSFEKMRENPMTNHQDVYSINSQVSPLMRKGQVGDWKSVFTVQQNEDFTQIYLDKLSHLEIPFTYQLDF